MNTALGGFHSTPSASQQVLWSSPPLVSLSEASSSVPVETTFLRDLDHPISVQSILPPVHNQKLAGLGRGATRKRLSAPKRSLSAGTVPCQLNMRDRSHAQEASPAPSEATSSPTLTYQHWTVELPPGKKLRAKHTKTERYMLRKCKGPVSEERIAREALNTQPRELKD